MYEVLHSRLRSLSGSASSGSGGGGGGSASKSSSSSSQTDSGTHQALSTDGTIYTYNGTYGSGNATQQDDMNRYAHQIGNVG